jgi:class 3 adenylate cyclase
MALSLTLRGKEGTAISRWLPVVAALPALVIAAWYVPWVGDSGAGIAANALAASEAAAFALAGLGSWLRHRRSWTGPLLVVASYLSLAGALQRFTDSGGLYALGYVLGGTQEIILAYLLLTFPSGRAADTPIGWMARILLGAMVVLALLDVVTTATDRYCVNVYGFCSTQPNPLLVVDLGTTVRDLIATFFPPAAAIVLATVLWRFISAKGASRAALAPVLVAGALAAIAVGIREIGVFGDIRTGVVVSRAGEVLIPIALGVGFLRSRLARAGVGELLVRTGPHPSPRDLQSAIRNALRDPMARLLQWSPTTETYYDAEGAPTAGEVYYDRQLTEISDGDQRLGAIEHDPVLTEEADLVQSVVAAARIVMENERLSNSVVAQTADVARLPRGVITMMRTDIEESTELLTQLRERYPDLLLELRKMLRDAARHGGGSEIDSRADEFFAAFPDAVAAVRTAIEIQRQVALRRWPDDSAVRLRIGLHTGEPGLTSEGYVGLDVHLAARVSATGSGGQIVISDTTRDAIRDTIDEADVHELGTYRLKGIPQTVRLFQVDDASSPTSFPSLRAERVGE